jgi:hypothetical protein
MANEDVNERIFRLLKERDSILAKVEKYERELPAASWWWSWFLRRAIAFGRRVADDNEAEIARLALKQLD